MGWLLPKAAELVGTRFNYTRSGGKKNQTEAEASDAIEATPLRCRSESCYNSTPIAKSVGQKGPKKNPRGSSSHDWRCVDAWMRGCVDAQSRLGSDTKKIPPCPSRGEV